MESEIDGVGVVVPLVAERGGVGAGSDVVEEELERGRVVSARRKRSLRGIFVVVLREEYKGGWIELGEVVVGYD